MLLGADSYWFPSSTTYNAYRCFPVALVNFRQWLRGLGNRLFFQKASLYFNPFEFTRKITILDFQLLEDRVLHKGGCGSLTSPMGGLSP